METTEPTANFDYIAPAIRHLAVPLDTLAQDPANVRRHTQRNIDVIRASLRRFKQQTPLVIDSNRVIRKGNGTYEAARAEGWTHIAAVVSDLEGAEATSYAIADNRAGDPEVGSTFDQLALAETLGALKAADESLVTDAGYSLDELAKLIGEANGDGVANDPDAQWQGMPECVSEDQTAFASVKVNFDSAESREAFAKLIGQNVTENTRSVWYPPAPIGRTADKRYADAS